MRFSSPSLLRGLLSLWLLLLLALLAPGAGASAEDPEPRTVEEIMRQIRYERDDVPNRVFGELARHGTLDAFDAFRKAVRLIKAEGKLRRIYRYGLPFGEEGGLRESTLLWLREEASLAPSTAARVGATRALGRLGEEGTLLCDEILRSSRQAPIRAAAAAAVLPLLATRGNVELLRRILEDLPSSAVRAFGPALRQASLDADAVRPLLVPRILDRRTPETLRVILLELLVRDGSEAVTLVLLQLADRGTPLLQHRALEALIERGAQRRAAETVKRLLRSPLPELRVVAIRAVGGLGLDDEAWVKKLFSLARSRDQVNRIGAAYALAELRTVEAIELLYSLLEDEDWSVRSVAIEGIVALRREDSLPRLIERLDHEEGRVLEDLVRGLQWLSGLDLGRRRPRWHAWWSAEGEGFRIPPPDQVRERLALREKRRSENLSSASFYGIPVISNRICLIVDTSGSMSYPAAMSDRTSSEGEEPTRFEVAIEQLRGLLQRISDGRYCNIIFFSGGITPWEDEVRALDEKGREDALDFVDRRKVGGGTNIFDALHLAFSDPGVDTIYLLSDGDPSSGRITDPGELREEIDRRNELRRIRIHCVSVGKVSSLLRHLAEDSLGVYREVGIRGKKR
jgi:hypothetical protein